jgi:hypothetical protein
MTMTSKSDNQAAKGPRHGLNAEEIEKVQQSARNCAVRLGLDDAEPASVLHITEGQARSFRAGSELVGGPDTAYRSLQLVRVYWALVAMVGDAGLYDPEHQGPARTWLRGYNRAFGAVPLQHMTEDQGLDAVVGYLEAANG